MATARKPKPRKRHAPSKLGPTLCGVRGDLALTAADVTCRTCLGWPELVAKAYAIAEPEGTT